MQCNDFCLRRSARDEIKDAISRTVSDNSEFAERTIPKSTACSAAT